VKITIQTTEGQRDCLAYETCVHGLVANRVDGNGRDWTLTHLASGRHFRVAVPSLDDIRDAVRSTEERLNAEGFRCQWSKSLGPMEELAKQRDGRGLWIRCFRRSALLVDGAWAPE
jgi:hypothetical protein